MLKHLLEVWPPSPSLRTDVPSRLYAVIRKISTGACAPFSELTTKMPTTNARQIAAVVHDVLRQGSYTTIADLADATKARAARLRIPYDADGVTAAITLVERSRPVLEVDAQRRQRFPVDPDRRFDPPFTHADAAATLARLGIRL
jgi:hypothetical protein